MRDVNRIEVGKTYLYCTSDFWYCVGSVLEGVKILKVSRYFALVQWPRRVMFGWWKPKPKWVLLSEIWDEVKDDFIG